MAMRNLLEAWQRVELIGLGFSVVEGLSGGKEWGVRFRGVGLGLRVGGVLQGLKDPPNAEP